MLKIEWEEKAHTEARTATIVHMSQCVDIIAAAAAPSQSMQTRRATTPESRTILGTRDNAIASFFIVAFGDWFFYILGSNKIDSSVAIHHRCGDGAGRHVVVNSTQVTFDRL